MATAEMAFKDSEDNLVVIMTPVLKKLFSYRQKCFSCTEAAGVLIGERRGSHMIVKSMSEPGLGDLRSRYAVDRTGSHHQAAIDEAFFLSGGILQYLGEWHTHPEDIPSPSVKDKNSWKYQLIESDPMILLIVGRKKLWAAKKEKGLIIPIWEI
jgi:integrative and conjugative element protein (TIGR02256 family)